MKKNQKINQQDVLNGIEVLKNACVTYKGMKKRAENQSANTGKQPTNTAQQPAKAQPGAKPENTNDISWWDRAKNSYGSVKKSLGNVNAAQWGAGAGTGLAAFLATKFFLDSGKKKDERGSWFWPLMLGLAGTGIGTYAANRYGLGVPAPEAQKKASVNGISQQDIANGIEVLKNACVTYKGMKKKAANDIPFYLRNVPNAGNLAIRTSNVPMLDALRINSMDNKLKETSPGLMLTNPNLFVNNKDPYAEVPKTLEVMEAKAKSEGPSVWKKLTNSLGNVNAAQWGTGAGTGLAAFLATKLFLDRNKEKEEKGAWFWPTLLGLAAMAGGTYGANKFNLGID